MANRQYNFLEALSSEGAAPWNFGIPQTLPNIGKAQQAIGDFAAAPFKAISGALTSQKRTAQLDWNPDTAIQDYLGASQKGSEFDTWARTQNQGNNSMAAYQAWQKSKADAAAQQAQDAADMQTEAGAKRLSPGSFAPIQPMGAAKYGAPQSFLAALKG